MMKRDKRLWDITCLITVLSVFLTVIAEARPNQFFFLAKPTVGKHTHILTEVRHYPDLAFFWKMNQRVNRDALGLSALQKTRMNEEFWKLFVHTIAIQQDALRRTLDMSEKEGFAFQPERLASYQQLGQIFAGHFKAFREILTPEQRNTLRKRKAAAKMFVRLHIEAEPRALALTTRMVTAQFTQFQTHFSGVTTGALHHVAWGRLADADSRPPLTQDLQQLQILRL